MIVVLLLILSLPLLVAPFETAGWWTQRHRRELKPLGQQPAPEPGVRAQLIYFTGVAGYSGDFLARREAALLDRIRQRFPQLRVHSEVFPYSVNNNPLNGERMFRKLWEWLHRWRLKVPNNVFDALIVLRNVGQLLVSADPRYGPFYNRGLAEALREKLNPELPTIFLAYSGGAQMAIGSAGPYMESHRAPLHLLALGGVFTDDPGIEHFTSVTQIVGRQDRFIVRLGRLIFPGLWRMMFWSAWNRYRRSPRFQRVFSGPHRHVGACDYFSFKPVNRDAETTPTYADLTFGILDGRLSDLLQATPAETP